MAYLFSRAQQGSCKTGARQQCANEHRRRHRRRSSIEGASAASCESAAAPSAALSRHRRSARAWRPRPRGVVGPDHGSVTVARRGRHGHPDGRRNAPHRRRELGVVPRRRQVARAGARAPDRRQVSVHRSSVVTIQERTSATTYRAGSSRSFHDSDAAQIQTADDSDDVSWRLRMTDAAPPSSTPPTAAVWSRDAREAAGHET